MMNFKTKDKPIFYIDPQSMINLAKYDYHLLQGMTLNIYYFCSIHYDYKDNPDIHFRKVFSYNRKSSNMLKAISYVWSYFLIILQAIILRPSVVHIQWFRIPRFDYAVVRLLQRMLKIKVVFTAHNILPHQGNESKNTDTFRKAYHCFDRIIVHSQTTKNEIIETFHVDGNKIEVIRHGILPFDISAEHYNACKQQLDAKYAVLQGKTIFSALGFQNFYKGTDLLAHVWSETPELRDNKDAMLLIIGKVNAADMDLSMLEGIDNVIFDNRRIPDEEFLYLLRHTSVYLLPYREISQSGALLTVIAEHIPVLVTNKGAMTEPFEIANIGWVINEAKEEELRQALIHLVQHPEEIIKVKESTDNWNKVCQHYSWYLISQATQQLYLTINT